MFYVIAKSFSEMVLKLQLLLNYVIKRDKC